MEKRNTRLRTLFRNAPWLEAIAALGRETWPPLVTPLRLVADQRRWDT